MARVHAGNLHEAARHTGIPYATLREIHQGAVASPGLGTVAALAGAYRLPVDWFLREGLDRPAPAMGWVGILPPDPETGADPRYARRVTIPFAAGAFLTVALRLEAWLGGLPPSPSRPIVGGATEEFEFRRRLTAFLLQPVLAARAAGADLPLPAEPPYRGDPPMTPERRARWVALLQELGAFWERALGSLLPPAGRRRR